MRVVVRVVTTGGLWKFGVYFPRVERGLAERAVEKVTDVGVGQEPALVEEPLREPFPEALAVECMLAA